MSKTRAHVYDNKMLGKKDRRVRLRTTNWVFTLNNYTEEEVTHIQMQADPELNGSPTNVAFVAFSFEIGGKKGTPHLQGFLQLYKKGIIFYYINPPKVGQGCRYNITGNL